MINSDSLYEIFGFKRCYRSFRRDFVINLQGLARPTALQNHVSAGHPQDLPDMVKGSIKPNPNPRNKKLTRPGEFKGVF